MRTGLGIEVKAFPFKLRYRMCVRSENVVGRAVKRLNPSANLHEIEARNTQFELNVTHLDTGVETTSFELDRPSATSSCATSSLI